MRYVVSLAIVIALCGVLDAYAAQQIALYVKSQFSAISEALDHATGN